MGHTWNVWESSGSGQTRDLTPGPPSCLHCPGKPVSARAQKTASGRCVSRERCAQVGAWQGARLTQLCSSLPALKETGKIGSDDDKCCAENKVGWRQGCWHSRQGGRSGEVLRIAICMKAVSHSASAKELKWEPPGMCEEQNGQRGRVQSPPKFDENSSEAF